MPPPGCPQANGRQPETPRQVWQRPCTVSQVVHSGVACPCSHCSAGQTATAEHLPVAVPPSHQDPVLLPQSQQGRYSPASSPITLSSSPHPTPPTPLTRARPVRTGCSISHGLHAFVLKYRYLSQFSVPLLIPGDTLYKLKMGPFSVWNHTVATTRVRRTTDAEAKAGRTSLLTQQAQLV